MAQSNFAELAAFVAVAKRKSFKRASIDLVVSASAVSYSIRQLELARRPVHRSANCR